jgi:arabinogalactan oligomer/maltooligosaccharide transport system substrate-binding protein
MVWRTHHGRSPTKRSFLAAGLGLSGTALLAACGQSAPKKRPALVVWHSYRGREKAALEEVAALYSAQVAGKTRPVRCVGVPNDAFADKISAAVPRKKGPDLFIFPHDRMGGWVESGNTVAPIDFFLSEEDRQGFLPGMLDATTYKGVTYALPLNFKSAALIYNKKMVPKPPRTTAELVEIATKLTDKARGRFGFAYAYDDYFFHAGIANGFGGGAFNAAGDLILNDPANVAASDLVRTWRSELNLLPDDPANSLVTALFNEERAAMVMSGPWFLGEASKSIDLGIAVLPMISEANNKPMRPWMTIEAIYLAAGTADEHEAWQFARFLAGPQASAIMAQKGGQLPASHAAYRLPAIASDPIISAFKAQGAFALPMPNLPEMTLVWSPADKAMKRFTKMETTSQSAWNDCQSEVQAAINALKASQAGGRA